MPSVLNYDDSSLKLICDKSKPSEKRKILGDNRDRLTFFVDNTVVVNINDTVNNWYTNNRCRDGIKHRKYVMCRKRKAGCMSRN